VKTFDDQEEEPPIDFERSSRGDVTEFLKG